MVIQREASFHWRLTISGLTSLLAMLSGLYPSVVLAADNPCGDPSSNYLSINQNGARFDIRAIVTFQHSLVGLGSNSMRVEALQNLTLRPDHSLFNGTAQQVGSSSDRDPLSFNVPLS